MSLGWLILFVVLDYVGVDLVPPCQMDGMTRGYNHGEFIYFTFNLLYDGQLSYAKTSHSFGVAEYFVVFFACSIFKARQSAPKWMDG